MGDLFVNIYKEDGFGCFNFQGLRGPEVTLDIGV